MKCGAKSSAQISQANNMNVISTVICALTILAYHHAQGDVSIGYKRV